MTCRSKKIKKLKRKYYKFPDNHQVKGTASTIADVDKLIDSHRRRNNSPAPKPDIYWLSTVLDCHAVYSDGTEKVVKFDFRLYHREDHHPCYAEIYAVYDCDFWPPLDDSPFQNNKENKA